MAHLFEHITSLSDLAEQIRDWRSFADPDVYDDGGGFAQLFAACLDHLGRHALPIEIEDIGERLTHEQAQMVLRLAQALQRNPAAWRESPTP